MLPEFVICKSAAGVDSPIPTRPELSMRMRSVSTVKNFMLEPNDTAFISRSSVSEALSSILPRVVPPSRK